MAGLVGKVARLAASPQGKRALARVQQEARRPENRERAKQLAQRAQAAATSTRTAYREGRDEPAPSSDEGAATTQGRQLGPVQDRRPER